MTHTEPDLSPAAAIILKRACAPAAAGMHWPAQDPRRPPNVSGYVMVDDFDGIGVAYSLGINDGVS